MQIETEKNIYQHLRGDKVLPDDPSWIDKLTETEAKAALRAAVANLTDGQVRAIKRCLEIAEEAKACAKGTNDFDTAYAGAARHIAGKIREEFHFILPKTGC